jgi:hypothetical protein
MVSKSTGDEIPRINAQEKATQLARALEKPQNAVLTVFFSVSGQELLNKKK